MAYESSSQRAARRAAMRNNYIKRPPSSSAWADKQLVGGPARSEAFRSGLMYAHALQFTELAEDAYSRSGRYSMTGQDAEDFDAGYSHGLDVIRRYGI